MLKVAGLFAGVGGIELGFQRAGFESSLLCEKDEVARHVLAKRFPHVSSRRLKATSDITKLKSLPTGIDLVTAGFPCQDLSQAGLMKGMAGENSSLVSHVFRLLRRREVEWVLLENVPFMLQLGKGAAIRSVVTELEKLNYSWAFRVVDTRAFGIPQRRRRVYLLASLSSDPSRVLFADGFSPPEKHQHKGRACGFYWTEGTRGLGWAIDAIPTLKGGSGLGIPSAPAIWFPNNRIGTPAIEDAERLQGFESGWTEPAEEIARPGLRWKLVGNAVTVDCAEWVGRCIRRAPGPRPEVVGQLPQSSSWPNAGFGAPDSDRCEVDVSEWPEQKNVPSLEQFLKFPIKPLSLKATSGFYKRLKASGLRRPNAFDQALEAHISSIQSSAPEAEYVKSKVAV